MKKRMLLFAIVLLSSWVVLAQDVDFSYLIGRDNATVYVEGDDESVVIGGALYYRVFGWESNGRYVLTVTERPDDASRYTILVLDMEVRESIPLLVDMDINTTNLQAITDDTVYFTILVQDFLGDDEQGLGILRFEVYAWAFEESQTAVTHIGDIPYAVGCGGSGVRSAIDNVYSAEVRGDTYFEYNRPVFAVTPYGIVHSNSCTAIRTLLTNPATMESAELASNLRWARVSPDGRWVAGTSDNSLLLIDLETMTITTVATADAPIVSITWARDSSGFYFVSRTTDGQQIDITDSNGVLDMYDPFDTITYPRPEDALQWHSAIIHYDLATGGSTELYSADAYALGNMVQVNDSLVFSQIETPREWVQASVDNPLNGDTSLIPVTVWQLNLSDGQSIQVADDLRGILVRPE